MRSILLVGSVGVGKTTLKQRLRGEDLEYAKTQALEVHDGVIDTPGEFLESRFYKHSLINASYDVDTVVLVQAADLQAMVCPRPFQFGDRILEEAHRPAQTAQRLLAVRHHVRTPQLMHLDAMFQRAQELVRLVHRLAVLAADVATPRQRPQRAQRGRLVDLVVAASMHQLEQLHRELHVAQAT